MATPSSLALSADSRLWLIATAATTVAVASLYKRIAESASSLLQKTYVNFVVARRKPPSVAGIVTHLNIHPGEFLLTVSGLSNDELPWSSAVGS
jgi:hypothetical protein